jgi:hypothetical protein
MSIKENRPRFLEGLGYDVIRELRVTVQHFGDLGSRQGTRPYARLSLPRVITCLNPRCSYGGYDLKQTMDRLVNERPAQLRVAMACDGHDGAPMGRGRNNGCSNSVEIQFDATYR